ncbi:signal peptidase I [Blastococcus sp. TBT05-19]|uniref:signal peptidase I n=1 Tax=Blastococcus sp. TBT05-19 TaxID=2250581 RepID=UPI000DEA542F|nr:signal peptidase I [Blastococcus sp. TBT05-19]RBY92372.1 signal peptidase I [Blastococcus sp. TBT05-19]
MTSAPRVISTSAVAALVLVTLWLFWPASLGGGTTYLSTYGTSMEPGFSAGDLAVLSEAGSYSVGDVVAYRSESLGTVVMHRIVAADADGFITQGDNNDFLDEDRPTRDEILGSLFFRVPNGGQTLAALTSPWTLAVVGFATVLVVGAAKAGEERRARRARRRRAPSLRMPSFSVPALALPRPALPRPSLPRPTAGAVSMRARARARQVALASASVALVAALAAGALFLAPSTETGSETLAVTERGAFSYTGTATRGTTYPEGVIESGDTVWTKLTDGLTVSYASTLDSDGLTDLQGVLRLDVSVEAPDGWGAYLNSGPVVRLQDGTATASVTVDTTLAASVLAEHYAEVGGGGAGATLRITPTTATSGSVRGIPFEAEGPAPLDFALDATSLRLAGDAETALNTRTETEVTADQVVPRSFEVAGTTVPLGVARAAAVLVLALALACAAGGAWMGRIGRGDAADDFAVRHADRIVPVAAFATGGTVIDVSDAESLHRVAERFDTVVLHHAGEEEDVFAVRDVDATYRFVVPDAAARRRGKPPVPASHPAAAYDSDYTTPLPRAGGLRGRLA